MKDDVLYRIECGPGVSAFDAEMEALEAGLPFTPAQWSFARRNASSGSSGAPSAEPLDTTQQIPVETLKGLVKQCKKRLAHTCPARRK